MGGADLSQLHAWLLIHTLTLTRQRGDTCAAAGPPLRTRSCTHMQTGVPTLTCARTFNLCNYISDTPVNVSVDSHINHFLSVTCVFVC